ncbi:MAG: hypothetical protein ACRD2L_14785, partial [Terriglobia bacterium]
APPWARNSPGRDGAKRRAMFTNAVDGGESCQNGDGGVGQLAAPSNHSALAMSDREELPKFHSYNNGGAETAHHISVIPSPRNQRNRWRRPFYAL